MRLVVANTHDVDGQLFLSAFYYENGYVAGNLMKPYYLSELGEELRKLVWQNSANLSQFEMWTSTQALYIACLREADMAVQFKTPELTSETQRAIEEVKGVLHEIHGIPQEQQPEQQKEVQQKPSKWRRVIIHSLNKTIDIIGGNKL